MKSDAKKQRFPVIKEIVSGFIHDRWSCVCAVIIIIYLLVAAGMEAYTIYCRNMEITPVYAAENLDARFSPPSAQFWMGTDYLGRDVFWRAMAGTATAIKVGVIASGIACILGVALGALAGYFGGTIDDIINFLYSVFAAMPTLLFILSFALLVSKGFLAGDLTGVVNFMRDNLNTDPGMLAVYLAIGLTGWVTLCRVVRAETLKLREAGYIQAAKVAGVPAWKIIVRHIIPNVGHLIIIYFTLRFAYAIMTEVIVSYLGLGVQTAPSWGIMISDGQERLWRGIWWEVGAATIFMFFLVLALHTLGDKLRDIFDPRSERNF